MLSRLIFSRLYNNAILVVKAGENPIVPASQLQMNKTQKNFFFISFISNNTMQRRVDEIDHDFEKKLCMMLQGTEFSLQFNESRLPNNKCHLLAYVRLFHDCKLCQDILFAQTLEIYTKGVTEKFLK